MERQIITTGDGSTTIHLPEWNEHYHSIHGAIQEAQHVFIKNGLHYLLEQRQFEQLDIMEIGFGTGLNAFITLIEALKLKAKIRYTGIEGYPIAMDEIELMNYSKEMQLSQKQKEYLLLHQTPWESLEAITSNFQLHKRQQFFADLQDNNTFDLIYFDAFGARVQPELWEISIFKIMYMALKPQGVLVTYAAKGSVRRAMQEVGFTTERLPGPPGKREMLRATKT